MAVPELNKMYKFDTLSPSMLGASYNNMLVEGIITATEAVKYRDIITLHNELKNDIAGLPASVNSCTFILFKNVYGDHEVLALEYIDNNTLEIIASVNIVITLTNTNTDDVAILSSRLKELGYTNFNITTT